VGAASAHPPESELQIAPYVIALLDSWKLILLGALFTSGFGALVAWVSPACYQASVIVNVVDPGDVGGVNPGSFRYREAMTVIETGFVLGSTGENHHDVIVSSLSSRDLAADFIESNRLLPTLFPKDWDATTQRWINAGAQPTISDGVRLLLAEHLSVEMDPETSIIEITMRAASPVVAADWANAIVVLFNQRERVKAISKSDRRITALVERLGDMQLVEIERGVYRIIEAETQVGLLARADVEYAVAVIDPAVPPEGAVGASVLRFAVVGSVLGFLFGTTLAAGRVLWREFAAWIRRSRGALE
jgi:uncharacterized protein involved in exopolysaccharide biosynthesis